MEFVWLVENKIAFFQNGIGVATCDAYFTFVNTDKFPKVVGFSRKTKITHIFKIVNTENFPNRNRILQFDSMISHSATPFYPITSICFIYIERTDVVDPHKNITAGSMLLLYIIIHEGETKSKVEMCREGKTQQHWTIVQLHWTKV